MTSKRCVRFLVTDLPDDDEILESLLKRRCPSPCGDVEEDFMKSMKDKYYRRLISNDRKIKLAAIREMINECPELDSRDTDVLLENINRCLTLWHNEETKRKACKCK